jgi:hypothetical protein
MTVRQQTLSQVDLLCAPLRNEHAGRAGGRGAGGQMRASFCGWRVPGAPAWRRIVKERLPAVAFISLRHGRLNSRAASASAALCRSSLRSYDLCASLCSDSNVRSTLVQILIFVLHLRSHAQRANTKMEEEGGKAKAVEQVHGVLWHEAMRGESLRGIRSCGTGIARARGAARPARDGPLTLVFCGRYHAAHGTRMSTSGVSTSVARRRSASSARFHDPPPRPRLACLCVGPVSRARRGQ